MSHLGKWEVRIWLFAFVVIFMCYAEKFQEDGRAYFAAVARMETIARESNAAVRDVHDWYEKDRDHVRIAAENSAVLVQKMNEALTRIVALQGHMRALEEEARTRIQDVVAQLTGLFEEAQRGIAQFDGTSRDLARIAAFTERCEAILAPLESLTRPFRRGEEEK